MVANRINIQRIDINTWLLTLGNFNILLDPWFYDPAIIGPILTIEHVDTLPLTVSDIKPDLILVTHHDKDHFDKKALKEFAQKDCALISTKKVCSLSRKMPFKKSTALTFWEDTTVDEGRIRITAVPGAHPKLLKENGYVIEFEDQVIYFAGDTYLIDEIKDIGNKFRINLALIPIIGIVFPIIGQIVMGPEEAVKALQLLNSAKMIPTSYGNIKFGGLMKNLIKTKGTLDDFLNLAKEKNPSVEILLPRPGETISLQ